jgi:hypothetical protein
VILPIFLSYSDSSSVKIIYMELWSHVSPFVQTIRVNGSMQQRPTWDFDNPPTVEVISHIQLCLKVHYHVKWPYHWTINVLRQSATSDHTSSMAIIILYSLLCVLDRLCGLVVRVPGYKSRGPGFDSRRYQIFWEVMGLEWGPLSLVRIIEELPERTVAAPV